jgi:hypothetical protein
MPNPNGTPTNLVAAHPGNRSRLVHGAYSPRLLEERAEKLFEAIMAEPHVAPCDAVGAAQIARLEARVEALDRALSHPRLSPQKLALLGDLQLRAIRRLTELLDRYGMTPKGRAEWARQLAEGESLAETSRRKRAEVGNSES